jgi:signal transduction histidine kinase
MEGRSSAVVEEYGCTTERLKGERLDPFGLELSGPGAVALVVEVAHDFRSPLTSILFMSQSLMTGQSGELNDLQRRQLGLIYGAALGLNALTSDMIELAEGGRRLLDREPSPFSVTGLFESVADMIGPMGDDKGLDVRILPPPDDRRVGHPSALSRILLNLSINALKFTDEGYVEIAAAPSTTDGIVFSVRDTGQGVTPTILHNLVQPFRPADGRNENLLCQTGLGLSICQKLLRAMGSELKIETRSGWGTRFHFELSLPMASPSGA